MIDVAPMHNRRRTHGKSMRLDFVASLALLLRRVSTAATACIALGVPRMKMLRLSFRPSTACGRKGQAKLQQQQQQQASGKTDGSVLFVAGALKDWLDPQSAQYSGLLVKRPFCARDDLRLEIDKALLRFGRGAQIAMEVKNGDPEELSNRLQASIALFLTEAGLPAGLSKQIHTDACSLGNLMGSMCPFADVIEVKLEVHGENVCSRWHQDWYAGRE